MKIKIKPLLLLSFLLLLHPIAAQESTATTEQTTTPLFSSDETLAVRLTYSNRDLLRETNDSTYLEAMLAYKDGDKPWDSVEVRLQARGNWRKKNCFLAPVKVRIKKKDAKGTLFEGNKELKFVLPCNNNDDGADYVLREYIAYKLYELVTPYHFKTRRMRIDYTDEKKNKGKEYALEAFMIEDIKTVADRNNAKQLKRKVHPLQQDHGTSVQNDFFQFMIANTDYSSAYQHNEKLLFVEGRQAIPVPYDFDMSGFVNANYAVVSQVQGEVLDINSVTDRLFRGFKRDNGVYDLVRKQYLDLKPQFMAIVEGKKSEFLKERSYNETHDFIEEFFRILANDGQYRSQILAVARTE